MGQNTPEIPDGMVKEVDHALVDLILGLLPEVLEQGKRVVVTLARPGQLTSFGRRLVKFGLAEPFEEGSNQVVLTDCGVHCLLGLVCRGRAALRGAAPGQEDLPRYVPGDRRLLWRGQEIRRLRRDTAAQHAILQGFQWAAWAGNIVNPIPPSPGVHPQEQLHEAIRGLNKGMKPGTIRFHMDGKGTGPCWEALS
jgi:hypothetical protein